MNLFKTYKSCQFEPVENLSKRLMLQQAQHDTFTYKAFIIACLLLFFNLQATHAQTAPTRGRLEIIKDSRIDSLIAHRYTVGKSGPRATVNSNYISAYGYRVQFFNGPNRKEAFNAQNRLLQMHPELRTYINYKEPNFKVKAGDFRSRLEASKLIQDLKGIFSSLFIISEKINPPKLADSNTNPQ
jgi:hypothetical protein